MNEAESLAFAEAMTLPDYPYLPGVNQRHHEETFRDAKAMLLSQTESSTAAANVPWLFGLRLFNFQFYWEAHEIWEALWLRALPSSREDHLVRSVIHLTNAALKGRLGRVRARMRLAALASEQCDAAFLRFDGPIMGLAEEEVREAADTLRQGSGAPSLGHIYAK